MNTHSMPGVRQQRGVSLMVALIFLVIMAMLGVTVANVTMLQERMAGHTRDRNVALQAAEAALRDAEVRLNNDAGFRAAAQAIVPLSTDANDDAFWTNCFKSTPRPALCAAPYTPTRALPTTGTEAVAEQPQYVVQSRTVGGATVYRVTTYAVGGTADSVVILQAEF